MWCVPVKLFSSLMDDEGAILWRQLERSLTETRVSGCRGDVG
jgi:hypothetical protein